MATALSGESTVLPDDVVVGVVVVLRGRERFEGEGDEAEEQAPQGRQLAVYRRPRYSVGVALAARAPERDCHTGYPCCCCWPDAPTPSFRYPPGVWEQRLLHSWHVSGFTLVRGQDIRAAAFSFEPTDRER